MVPEVSAQPQKAPQNENSKSESILNKLSLTEAESERVEATKDCFAKQLEISDQFSYDFDKYDEIKADVMSNSNDLRSK